MSARILSGKIIADEIKTEVADEIVRIREVHGFAPHLSVVRVGDNPASAVYVGDNPEVDIVGARRSGLLAVWKRDSYWAEPRDVDWVIDDLAELLPLMLGSDASRNLMV